MKSLPDSVRGILIRDLILYVGGFLVGMGIGKLICWAIL